jgi:hypothetical protein
MVTSVVTTWGAPSESAANATAVTINLSADLALTGVLAVFTPGAGNDVTMQQLVVR